MLGLLGVMVYSFDSNTRSTQARLDMSHCYSLGLGAVRYQQSLGFKHFGFRVVEIWFEGEALGFSHPSNCHDLLT